MHNHPSAIEQLALLPLDSTSEVEDLQTEVVEKVKRTGRKPKDIKGNRYGKLTVLKLTPERMTGDAVWLCKCDCGEKVKLSSSSLRRGTSSCGCIGMGVGRRGYRRNGVGTGQRKGARKLEYQLEHNRRNLYSNYRTNAIKRGYRWQLTYEQFCELTQQDCHYCGATPAQSHVARKAMSDGAPYVYNGIDRIINTKGYEVGNVVACCGRCNSAKMDTDINDFTEWVLRVAMRLAS